MLPTFSSIATVVAAIAGLAGSASAGVSPFHRRNAADAGWTPAKQTATPVATVHDSADDVMGQLAIPLLLGVAAAADMPAPTTPAELPVALEKRDSVRTCAYVSGISSIPLYCNSDEVCVYNSVYSMIGCCPETSTTCDIITTCLARSQTGISLANNQTRVCSDATYSECLTHSYVSGLFSGYSLIGCGKTKTTDGVYYSPTSSSSSSSSLSSSSSSSSLSSSSSSLLPSSTSFSSASITSSTAAPAHTTTHASSSKKKSSHTGAIAGGVVGGVVGLALLGALISFLLRRRNSSKSAPAAAAPPAAAPPAAAPPAAPAAASPATAAVAAGGYPGPAGSPAPGPASPPMQEVYGAAPSPGYNPYGQPYSAASTPYQDGTQFSGLSPAQTVTPYATPAPNPGMDFHSGPVPATLAELPAERTNEPRELA